MTDLQSRTFSFCNFGIFRNKLYSFVLFRNKQRHGIIRPQSDKLNHYTEAGCEIYSQLMIKIQQILHCRRSSVFLEAFKNIPYLVNLFLVLPLKINSKSEKIWKRWWYKSQRLIGDPFNQFLGIFHLKISLRHVWIRFRDL